MRASHVCLCVCLLCVPESNPPLHYFLQAVVGIDVVDDESKPEHEHLTGMAPTLPCPTLSKRFVCPGSTPTPEQWTSPNSPPYSYWMYYIYANLCVLNKLRASRGLCTFQFRPHCGEAGDVDHLVGTLPYPTLSTLVIPS